MEWLLWRPGLWNVSTQPTQPTRTRRKQYDLYNQRVLKSSLTVAHVGAKGPDFQLYSTPPLISVSQFIELMCHDVVYLSGDRPGRTGVVS